MLLLAIVGMLRLSGPAGAILVIVVLGTTSWMGVARFVRGQILSLREQDFIQAARALGMPLPMATWGTMIADGKDAPRRAPHVAGFPGLAIMGSVLSFNLLGDGLRDILDPKVRR